MIHGMAGYCLDPYFKEEDACTVWRGGQFMVEKSKSWGPAVYGEYPDDDARYPDMAMVMDTVTINENISLSETHVAIAVGVDKHDKYHALSSLGLGHDSSFLKGLEKSKLIASRTWSMFNGLAGDGDQRDGHLIFGGYDRAKISGRGSKMPIAAEDNPEFCLKSGNCCATRLKVTISDLVLNFPNGTDASLFSDSDDSFIACITPDYPNVMSMGQSPYFRRFEDLTRTMLKDRGGGLAAGAMRYSSRDKPYDGDLTIKIKAGPSIRIPNHQLVHSERSIDARTGKITTGGDKIVALEELPSKSPSTPQLGMLFLSSAYVMVNQDADEFTLWPALQEDAVDLVAVGKNGEELNTCGSAAPGPSAGGQGEDSSSSDVNNKDKQEMMEDEKNKLSAGVIAGVACSSVAAVAAIGFFALYLLRRRRRHSGNSGSQSRSSPNEIIEPPPPRPPPKGSELDSVSPSDGGWQQPAMSAITPHPLFYKEEPVHYANELAADRNDPHGIWTELQGNGGHPGRRHFELSG